MKTILDPLRDLLNSGAFLMANGYYFTLADGTILRYTDFDVDTGWSHAYCAGKVEFQRSSCSWKNDLSVDSMDLTMIPTENATINGVPFLQAVKNGIFDGAICTVERIFMKPDNLYVMGGIILFVGRVGNIEADRGKANMTLNSHLELLSIDFPINLYETSCGRMLYDAGCGVNPDDYDVNTTVKSTSTTDLIHLTLVAADGYYDNGMFEFTSGVCAGMTGTIKKFRNETGGTYMIPLIPLQATPAITNAVTLWAGCDKTMAMCSSKFNRLDFYRGFPFIPAVENAY